MSLRPRQQKAIDDLRVCSIEGCGKPHDSKGYCGMHAQRVRRYGDPHYVTSNEQFRENCRQAALTYKEAKPSTYRKRNNRHEHRVVAEQMLGRPLTRGEIVHHIDGNKHNNDPSNLQVMSMAEHARHHLAEIRATGRRVGGFKRKGEA